MKHFTQWTFVVTLVAVIAASAFAGKDEPAARDPLAQVDDIPGVPRVLLLGDSISIGYTLGVRDALAGKANVHRPPMNCADTQRGIDMLEQWLGDNEWDVIHFNWGLHDLKYINESFQMVSVDKAVLQLNRPDQYATNLDVLVEKLQKTGAKLIFATITPVPEGNTGRVPGDAAKYNALAKQVMADHGVQVNDLYAFVQPRLDEYQRPANVHFNETGNAALARHVAKVITDALPKQN